MQQEAPLIRPPEPAADAASDGPRPPGWVLELDREVAAVLEPVRETELDIRWNPLGRKHESTRILTVEQLAVWIATLAPGKWAVISLPADADARWAQVMRLDEEWIVEVHDGTPQDWASRVLHQGSTEPRDGISPAEAWSPLAAAEVTWSWMQGSLPDGCRRVRPIRRRAGTTADGVAWCTGSMPKNP